MRVNTIKISKLYKSFNSKKDVLNNINLHIENGMFGILGRNGSGKSTLMNILATIIQYSSGKVTINDIPLRKTQEIRKIIGYLPQDFDFYPNMKVEEALYYLGALSDLDKVDLKYKITEVLEKVNLNSNRKQKVKNLSGGMKKRLGIAQAILHDPYVVIVDEPTAGLDPEERVRLRNLLFRLAKDKIVIISTHIVSDIESTCEQIAIMDQGFVVYTGSISKLIHSSDNKVYELLIKPSKLEELKEKDLIITKVQEVESYLKVRFVSDKQLAEARKVKQDFEDAYMYFLKNM